MKNRVEDFDSLSIKMYLSPVKFAASKWIENKLLIQDYLEVLSRSILQTIGRKDLCAIDEAAFFGSTREQ